MRGLLGRAGRAIGRRVRAVGRRMGGRIGARLAGVRIAGGGAD